MTILLFLIIFSTSNAQDQRFGNLNKHLTYLSEKGIIDKSHLAFVENNELTKEDTMFYFYKIFKTIDKKKANQEDFVVIQSIIQELFETMNSLKDISWDAQKKREEFFKEIKAIKDELESSQKEYLELKERVTSLEQQLFDFGTEERLLSYVFYNWKINSFINLGVKYDGLGTDNGKYAKDLRLNLKLYNEPFKFKFFSDFDEIYLYSATFKLKALTFTILSPQNKRCFTDYKNFYPSSLESYGIELKNDLFHALLSLGDVSKTKENPLDIYLKVETKYFNLNFFNENIDMKSFLSHRTVFSAIVKMPINKFTPGLGIDVNRKRAGLLIFGEYLHSEKIRAIFNYLYNSEGNFLYPQIYCKLSEKIELGCFLAWSLLTTNSPIKAWKCYLKSGKEKAILSILIGQGSLDWKLVVNLDKFDLIFANGFRKEESDLNWHKAAMIELNFLLKKNFYIYFKGMFSSDEYKDDGFDISGKEFNPSYDSLNPKNSLSLGIKMEV